MALTELLFFIDKASIGTVTLDASVRELHRATARATDHPVEADEDSTGGADVVSDHVKVEPLQISIEGVVTNTPAEYAGALLNLLGGSFDPAGDAFKQFLEDLRGKKLVTVVTTLKTYEDVILEEISVVRNARYGNALYFTASGRQIRKVTTQTVDAPKPPTQVTKPAGKKPTKPPADEPAAEATTVLKKLTTLF